MKISVIIPVYNVKHYIKQCVCSILNQTYQDYELILVDDGSTDESIERVLPIIDHNKNIHVHRQANGGVSSARNKGIELASGDWLAFIDSDDCILPDYLEKLYSVTHKADFVLSGDRYLENGALIREDILPEWSWEVSSNCTETDIKYIENITSLHGKLFRRETLLRYNIKFDKSLRFGEDRDFCISYLSHISTISYIPYAGYCYNTDIAGSLSKQKVQNLLLTDINYWNKIHAVIGDACPKYQVNRLYNFIVDNLTSVYNTCGILDTIRQIRKVKPIVNSPFLHLYNKAIFAPKWLRYIILWLF